MDANYIAALTAKVNSINLCSDLQAATNQIMGDIQAQVDSLQPLIDQLAPLEILLHPPENLSQVISYLTVLAENYFAPQLRPIIALGEQAVAMVAAIEHLTTAIHNKAATLTDCSITITITPPTIP